MLSGLVVLGFMNFFYLGVGIEVDIYVFLCFNKNDFFMFFSVVDYMCLCELRFFFVLGC